MKFKTDENLPSEAAADLRAAGYDADSVFEESIVGAPDSQIIEVCTREERCLITLDTDFADIRNYPPSSHCGLIVLRLKQSDKLHVLDKIRELSHVLMSEDPNRSLWIVEEDRIRIRT